jgi:hypothetical protein
MHTTNYTALIRQGVEGHRPSSSFVTRTGLRNGTSTHVRPPKKHAVDPQYQWIADLQNPPKEPIKRTPLAWIIYKIFGNVDEPGNITLYHAGLRTAKVLAWGINHVLHIPHMLLAFYLYRINKSIQSNDSPLNTQPKGKP